MKAAYFWLIVPLVVCGLVGIAALISTPGSVAAAGPWYVTPGGDDGDDCLSPSTPCGSINGALAKATSGDTVYVAVGAFTGTGDPVVLIDKNITLSGGWDASFAVQDSLSTIDGQQARRCVRVSTGVVATMERFDVRGGHLGGWMTAHGAGIFNEGQLQLADSIVSGNVTSGGVNQNGAGIANTGILGIHGSQVTGNKSSGWGGGIYTTGTLSVDDSNVTENSGGSGAGIMNLGTMDIEASTIADNLGAGWGGGIYTEGTTVITETSITGNKANKGAGIMIYEGSLAVANTTLSQNTSLEGGGLYQLFGAVTLSNVTVVENVATLNPGGGLGVSSSGAMSLQNTIVANNTAGTGPDCYGAPTSAGYNLLEQAAGCALTPGTGDLVGVDPQVGVLIGSPSYHPLQESSPAIDAGNPLGCVDNLGSPLDADQRGAPRVGTCDIGAYEYTVPGLPAAISVYSGSPQHAPPSTPYAEALQALVVDDLGSPVGGATVTFSAPVTGPSAIFDDSGTESGTAITAGSGLATSSSFDANSESGSYLIEGSVAGVASPAEFSMGNVIWYVSTLGDDGNDCLNALTPCATIDGAVNKPGFLAGDRVMVAQGTYTGSGDQVVMLAKDVILSGGWDMSFEAQSGMVIMDGQHVRRGVTVSQADVRLERFELLNGEASQGGGVHAFRSTLTFETCTFEGNHASQGGAIWALIANVSLIECTLEANSATDGGAVWTSGGTFADDQGLFSDNIASSGGALYLGSDQATLTASTIRSNNASGMGGGIYNTGGVTLLGVDVDDNHALGANGGGIENYDGELTIVASVLHGNSAKNEGGAVASGGSGPVRFINSTLSGNSAQANGGGISNYGTMDLFSATIAENVATGLGGGVYISSLGPYLIRTQNTVLAKNLAASGPDCSGTVSSLGYTLLENASSCTFSAGPGDRVGVNLSLGPLQDNGGGTLTHALQRQCPSLAINAGNPAGCTDHLGAPLLADQRGMPRLHRCDIGAFEFQDEIGCLFLPCVLRNYCSPLYGDDFSASSSGWPVQDTGNVAYEYLSGEYRILLRSTDWWAAASPGFAAADYIVEADVRNAASPYGTYGLLFGLSTDGQEFYEFEIGPDGDYAVYKYNHGTWTALASGTSGAINAGTASNRVKILREGATIKAYANGTLLTTVADSSFTGSRRLGVIAFSYGEPNVDVRYDNFAVYPVTCTDLGGLVPSGQYPAGAMTDGDIWKEGARSGR